MKPCNKNIVKYFSANLYSRGFTLVELSIVLVVIGLIVGGVLVGRDLVTAANARAQISQLEKYHQSVNTFKGKYGYLPGDIPNPDANRFGFAARGIYDGMGDGNGIIQGIYGTTAGYSNGFMEIAGETALFWEDLSFAHLIDGNFNIALANTPIATPITLTSSPSMTAFLPQAKIGQGNFVYVWSGSAANIPTANFLGIAVITSEVWGNAVLSGPGLSVSQALNIDKKIDDGLPQSGGVIAAGAMGNPNPNWSAGGAGYGTADTSSTASSTTTCYDNSGSAGGVQQYSIAYNNGSGVNCLLSFRFQ